MVKPKEAWTEGTNIKLAVKHNPEIVRGWIMAEVGRLIKDVDANKTISSDEELKFVDWYDSVGWKVKGGNTIKDWKACARQWKRRNKQNTNAKKGFSTDNFTPDALNNFVNNG